MLHFDSWHPMTLQGEMEGTAGLLPHCFHFSLQTLLGTSTTHVLQEAGARMILIP